MTLNTSFHFPKWKGVHLQRGPTWPYQATRQNVTIISQFSPWTFRDPPKHNIHHCSSLSRADHQLGWVVQKAMVTAHHWMFPLQFVCPRQWHSWGKGIMVTKRMSQSLNSPFPSWHSSTENREILLLWECRSGKDLLPLASSAFPPS